MKTFGLIGKNIDYSFSRKYFNDKFKNERLDEHQYVNFDISDVNLIDEIFDQQHSGYNVTIPYKEKIIPFLDKLNEHAAKIGAVNTIKIYPNGIKEGFNTDFFGFSESIKPFLKPHHNKALILGTGGASKAVAYALEQLKISFLFVSRNPLNENEIAYADLNENHFKQATIIINTTPIGTFPDVDKEPPLPYAFFSEAHIAYDLIYNPAETQFLKKAKENKATTINGLRMLELQAEKAWEIWNS